VRYAALLVGWLISADVAVASEADPTAPATVAAVWIEHETVLRYQGFTAHYSCDGLRAKVRAILRELGARDGARVRAYGCAAPAYQPSPVANVKLSFATLQEAPADAEGETVTGRWQEVSLSPQGSRDIDRGDCELVEVVRDQLLPLFAHQIVYDRTRCIPHSRDGSTPGLRVRVLQPVP
jgi:hypothetical protein